MPPESEEGFVKAASAAKRRRRNDGAYSSSVGDLFSESLSKISRDASGFLKSQSQVMLSYECHSAGHKWRKEPNLLVGLSSLFYSIPSLLLIWLIVNKNGCTDRIGIWFEIVLYALTGIFSFAADYLYSGRTSIFHAIDRCVATTSTVLTILKGFFFAPFYFYEKLTFPLLIYLFLGLLSLSRNSQKRQDWLFYHFFWHVAGSSFMMLCVVVEFNRTPKCYSF